MGCNVGLIGVSGAAKVDLSPESCSFWRKHETLHKCSIVHIDHWKNRPQKFATLGGRHIDFQYGPKMTIVLPISPVLFHLGPYMPRTNIQVYIYIHLCFQCLGTFWQCQNLRQETAILDFKMAAISESESEMFLFETVTNAYSDSVVWWACSSVKLRRSWLIH